MYTPKFEVFCGLKSGNGIKTTDPRFNGLFEFEPDVDEADCDYAARELEYLLTDANFGHPGRRNSDGVNLCITLYVLGIEASDMEDWFKDLDYAVDFEAHDYNALMEKIRTVKDYLHGWGPDGHREDAVNFMV